MIPAILGAGLVGFLIGFVPMAVSRRRARASAAVIMSCWICVLCLISVSCLISFGGRPGLAHEGEDHSNPNPKPAAPPTGSELAQRLPDGAIFVPKAVQRIFGLRTELTENRAYRRSIELPGRIIPDPNTSGYVQAAIGGRLAPPPGGFPRLGSPVKQGDVLAYLTPPLQAIDVSTMRQQQGDLDQQISIVERRLARYETIGPSGASRARSSKTHGLSFRVSSSGARRSTMSAASPKRLWRRSTVSSPTEHPLPARFAQPNGVIFQIIDPLRLWVEALSFEAIVGTQDASAVTCERPQALRSHHADRASPTAVNRSRFILRSKAISRGRAPASS